MRSVLAADYGDTAGRVGDKPRGVVPEDELSEEDERLSLIDEDEPRVLSCQEVRDQEVSRIGNR